MPLRPLATAAVVLVLLVLGGAAAIWEHTELLRRFTDLETSRAEINVQRCVNAVEAWSDSGAANAADWACWDATWEFAGGANRSYVADNVTWDVFRDSGEVSLMAVYTSSLERVWGEFLPRADGPPQEAAFLDALLAARPDLLPPAEDTGATRTDIVDTPYGALALSTHAIVRTDGSGPSRGYLAIGAFLTPDITERLSRQIYVDFTTITTSQAARDPARTADLARLRHAPIDTHALDDYWLQGHGLVVDDRGEPVLAVVASLPRQITEEGQRAVGAALLATAGAVLSLALAVATVGISAHRRARRRAEELEQAVSERTLALRSAERMLRAVIEQSPVAIVLADLDGMPVLANQFALLAQSGGEGLLGVNICDWPTPSADPAARTRVQEALGSVREGRATSFELAVKEGDGEGEHYWTIYFVPVLDDAGEVERLAIVAADVTPLRQAQVALEQERSDVMRLLSALPVGWFIVDAATRTIVEASPLACEVSGLAREQIVGHLCHRFVCPADEANCPVLDHSQTVDRSQRVIVTADGARRPILKSVVPMRWQHRDVLVECFMDLGEIHEAHEALARSEAWFRTVIDTTEEGFIVLDAAGAVTEANAAASRMLGTTREALVGTPIREHVHETAREEFDAQIDRRREGLSSTYETTFRKADGAAVPVLVSGTPILGADGDYAGTFGMIADLAGQRRLAEELDEARRAAEAANRAKSVFLANMSHEIRTPMNAVLGFAQLMLGEPELPKTARSYTERLLRAGEHLLDLINEILEMSRIEAGRVDLRDDTFDIFALLSDVESLFRSRADAAGLSFAVVPDPAMPRALRGDQAKLRQILVNLTGNALKFTERGFVRLRVWCRPHRAPWAALRFEIQDSGPGIAAEDLEHLFRPFEQSQAGRTRGGGTGLGLSISRSFARLMGGDILVSSTVGRGTSFRGVVRVRMCEEQDSLVAVERLVRARALRLRPGEERRRVLIADDSEHNRELLALAIERAGFETRFAGDGAEAVRIWEEWRPHAILMDIHMPVMDGLEATRTIRARQGAEGVVIIAVTAAVMAEDQQAAKEAGCDGFASKPIHIEDVLARLGAALGVRYVMESAAEHSESPSLTAEQARGLVVGLPTDLVERLGHALRAALTEQVRALIDEVRACSPPLADHLTPMVQRYEYARVLSLLLGKD